MMPTTDAVAQDDLAEILRALGLSDAARPYSCHETVLRDVLPAIRSLRSQLQEWRRAGGQDGMLLLRLLRLRNGEPLEPHGL